MMKIYFAFWLIHKSVFNPSYYKLEDGQFMKNKTENAKIGKTKSW